MVIIEKTWWTDNPSGGTRKLNHCKYKVFSDDDIEGVQKFLDECCEKSYNYVDYSYERGNVEFIKL